MLENSDIYETKQITESQEILSEENKETELIEKPTLTISPDKKELDLIRENEKILYSAKPVAIENFVEYVELENNINVIEENLINENITPLSQMSARASRPGGDWINYYFTDYNMFFYLDEPKGTQIKMILDQLKSTFGGVRSNIRNLDNKVSSHQTNINNAFKRIANAEANVKNLFNLHNSQQTKISVNEAGVSNAEANIKTLFDLHNGQQRAISVNEAGVTNAEGNIKRLFDLHNTTQSKISDANDFAEKERIKLFNNGKIYMNRINSSDKKISNINTEILKLTSKSNSTNKALAATNDNIITRVDAAQKYTKEVHEFAKGQRESLSKRLDGRIDNVDSYAKQVHEISKNERLRIIGIVDSDRELSKKEREKIFRNTDVISQNLSNTDKYISELNEFSKAERNKISSDLEVVKKTGESERAKIFRNMDVAFHSINELKEDKTKLIDLLESGLLVSINNHLSNLDTLFSVKKIGEKGNFFTILNKNFDDIAVYLRDTVKSIETFEKNYSSHMDRYFGVEGEIDSPNGRFSKYLYDLTYRIRFTTIEQTDLIIANQLLAIKNQATSITHLETFSSKIDDIKNLLIELKNKDFSITINKEKEDGILKALINAISEVIQTSIQSFTSVVETLVGSLSDNLLKIYELIENLGSKILGLIIPENLDFMDTSFKDVNRKFSVKFGNLGELVTSLFSIFKVDRNSDFVDYISFDFMGFTFKPDLEMLNKIVSPARALMSVSLYMTTLIAVYRRITGTGDLINDN